MPEMDFKGWRIGWFQMKGEKDKHKEKVIQKSGIQGKTVYYIMIKIIGVKQLCDLEN